MTRQSGTRCQAGYGRPSGTAWQRSGCRCNCDSVAMQARCRQVLQAAGDGRQPKYRGGERGSGGGLQRLRSRHHIASRSRQFMELAASGCKLAHIRGSRRVGLYARRHARLSRADCDTHAHTERQDGRRREARYAEEGHAAGRGTKIASVRRAEPLQDSDREFM